MIMGKGATEYRRTWPVKDEHVPRVLQAALWDLLADTGIPTAAEDQQGYPVRPLNEGTIPRCR